MYIFSIHMYIYLYSLVDFLIHSLYVPGTRHSIICFQHSKKLRTAQNPQYLYPELTSATLAPKSHACMQEMMLMFNTELDIL